MFKPAKIHAKNVFHLSVRRRPIIYRRNITSLSCESYQASLLFSVSRRTKSSLESSNDTMEKRWRESTQKLLIKDQIGSFDSLHWQLGETMILYWAEKEQNGIQKCFEILERLVDEAALNKEANFTMDIYIIHKGWNKSFKKGKTDILPSEMLKKIDYFASMSNCFEPNIASYTMILDAASHCPNPKERLEFSEALLVRLLTESSSNPKVSPTTVTISTVINAFARSGSANAAERAESLLDLAQTMHDDGWIGVEPNAIMYTSVINAWAKAGNPSRAERLLKKMYKDYTLNGNSNVKPNLWSFNTVLAAWSKSSSTSAVESSEKLFRKMIDLKEAGVLDSRPDTVGYNCLLHTLARRRKTFVNAGLKAETLVEEMYETANATGDESVLPNEITYIALLKILNACASVNKAERAKYWVEKLKQDQRTHNILRDSFVVDQLLQLGWTDDGGKRT